jgi:hypothetical protein
MHDLPIDPIIVNDLNTQKLSDETANKLKDIFQKAGADLATRIKDLHVTIIKSSERWTLSDPHNGNRVSFIISMDAAGLHLVDNDTYCGYTYERCRLRPSTHSAIALCAFVYAVLTMILFFMIGSDTALPAVSQMKELLRQINMPEIFIAQTKWALIVLFSIFYLHFARIYLSFIFIEQSPSYYRNVHSPIYGRPLLRWTEWLLRLAIFGFMVLYLTIINTTEVYKSRQQEQQQHVKADHSKADYVTDMQILNQQNQYTDVSRTTSPNPPKTGFHFFTSFFGPLIFIYAALLIWDIFMYRVVPIGSRAKSSNFRYLFLLYFVADLWPHSLRRNRKNIGEKDVRLKWATSDILGMGTLMLLMLIEFSLIPLTLGLFLPILSLIVIFAFLSAKRLIGDLFQNRQEYLGYLKELLPIRQIECGKWCPVVGGRSR